MAFGDRVARANCRDAGRPPDRAIPTEYPDLPPWRVMASRTTAARAAIPRSRDDVPTLARPGDPCASRKRSPDPLQEQENRVAARFVKPSAGLEPATPSLPWRSRHRGDSLPDG